MSDIDDIRARCSRLGFGCASYWAKTVFPRQRAIGLVHDAVELGITVFDTGPMYAAGEAERRLGAALGAHRRDPLVIMSKAGEPASAHAPKDFSPAAIEHSARASLGRLGIEHLDVLWLHGCPRSEWNDGLRRGLEQLKSLGLARLVGLNTFDADDIAAAIDEPMFDALMFDINLLRPENAMAAERAAARGKLVFSAAALARAAWNRHWWGIRAPSDVWYWLRANAVREKSVRVGEGGAAKPESAAHALTWVLDQAAVTCALVNTTRHAHLRENVACMRAQVRGSD